MTSFTLFVRELKSLSRRWWQSCLALAVMTERRTGIQSGSKAAREPLENRYVTYARHTLKYAALFVMLFTLGIGNVWGDEQLVYTLDGTTTGGTNEYAEASDITQSSKAWKVTGNTTISPWRIGGKKISEVDRPIYTTFTFTDNISKVTVETGSSTLDNVHSITLIVSSSQNGAGTVTSSIAQTSSLTSTTLTFERPAGKDWSGKYFSIVFNVSKSANSNAYVEFKNAKFYKEVSCTPLAAPGSPSSTAHATSVDLSWNSVSGATGYLVTFNGTEYNIASGTTTKTISGLSMETEYHWTVSAKGDGTTNCAVGTATADQTVTTLDDCTGTKVTYSVTSTSAVSVSGTAPTGATATYSSTYSSKCQLTGGNSMTLTLSGYKGYIIKSIKLSMKSNSGGGSGNFSAVAGTTTISSISTAYFNSASWNGAYTTSYVTIVPTMSNDGYTIKKDEDVVITIAATANSLYCESFSICYEEGCTALGGINGSFFWTIGKGYLTR